MAEQVALSLFAYGIGSMARRLLEEDPETPLLDEKPKTTATRGDFAPLVIGTRRIGPFVSWVGNRTVGQETNSSGGKGSGGGGVSQTVYKEDGIHTLCVGPTYAIRRIWINGAEAKLPAGGITSDSHPSGSSVTIAFLQDGGNASATMQVYWGSDSDPVDAFAGHSSRLGVLSTWPFLTRVNWSQFRLGGFAVWPTIEYEVENKPYGTGALTAESSWMANGPGRTGILRNILRANNSTDVGGINPPNIGIYLDRTDEYATLVDIQGQDLASVNGLYPVAKATYNSTTRHEYVPHDSNVNFSDISKLNNDLTDASWVSGDLGGAVTDPSITLSSPPPLSAAVGTVYKLETSNIWSDLYSKGQNTKFQLTAAADETVQAFKFYFKGLRPYGAAAGVAGSDYIEVGFVNDSDPSGTKHKVKLSYDAFQNVVVDKTNANGAYIGASDLSYYLGWDSTQTKPESGEEAWYYLQVKYKTGAGPNPSSSADIRRWEISWKRNDATDPVLYVCSMDSGTPLQTMDRSQTGSTLVGVTTVELGKSLIGAEEDAGKAEGVGEGALFSSGAADGANPAHALYQLLFLPFPHGAGRDVSEWDLASLEALSSLAVAEGARTHVLANSGKKAKGIISAILHDFHAYITWDMSIGKYVFGTIRDTSGQTLPEIPAEAVESPVPQHDINLEGDLANQLVFSYASRHLAYRNSTRSPQEDNIAAEFNNRVIKKLSITTATDSFYVDAIAERKQLEDLVPTKTYKFVTTRDAKMLHPGRAFTVKDFPSAGEEETLRLIEAKYSPGDKSVELNAMVDLASLAVPASSSLAPPDPGFEGKVANVLAPLEDAASAIWELSPELSKGTLSFMMLRIRANQQSGATAVYTSKDDISYTLAATDVPYCTGGTLQEATDATGSDIDTLLIQALGEDMDDMPLTLDDNNWNAGQQLCIIGQEVFFLKSVSKMGNGIYQLNNLKRAKHDTSATTHAIGDTVFIFPYGHIKPIRDPLLTVGSNFYAKPVPAGLTLAGISSAKALLMLSGGSTLDYDGSPTTTTLRDSLITLGVMKDS